MRIHSDLKRRSLFIRNAGLPPGSLLEEKDRIYTSDIEVIRYCKDSVNRLKKSKDEILSLSLSESDILWINVIGIGDSDCLRILENKFGLSSLTLESIQNVGQRPAINDFGHYIHMILKMITWDSKNKSLSSEQVSLILGEHFVISIQERAGDLFEPIRERILKGRGRIRGKGSDYLFFALIDAVVDNLFLICDVLQEQEEILEENAKVEYSSDIFKGIGFLKQQLISLRRTVWPLRELLSSIQRDEFELIGDDNLKYYRDVLDHTLIIIDMLEHLREILISFHESLITDISIEMNNIMKVLTIIATIFIPLTFIAGIYGMNFSFMPELEWRWGYFAILAFMALLFLLMMLFFKRKKWL